MDGQTEKRRSGLEVCNMDFFYITAKKKGIVSWPNTDALQGKQVY